MAEARRTHQLPGQEAKILAAQTARGVTLKTFEDLTAPEKDQLLKAVALRLGMIAPSRQEG